MQDQDVRQALDVIAEVKGLLARKRRIFEQFLLSWYMRILIFFIALVLVGIGVWLVIDGKSFVRVWFSLGWGWLFLFLLFVLVGGWLKFCAWRSLSLAESPLHSLFEVIGKPLLWMDGLGILVFLTLHVWIVLQGKWWYLFPLWAVGSGLVYGMYGAFLSVWSLLVIGIWSMVGGLVTLFFVPQTLAGIGWAFLVVFGFSYVGLFGFLEILARTRK